MKHFLTPLRLCPATLFSRGRGVIFMLFLIVVIGSCAYEVRMKRTTEFSRTKENPCDSVKAKPAKKE